MNEPICNFKKKSINKCNFLNDKAKSRKILMHVNQERNFNLFFVVWNAQSVKMLESAISKMNKNVISKLVYTVCISS